MARVTVEDCVDKIPNRFDLVLLASQRARALAAGSPVTLDRDNDKNPVVALREVAEETISPEELKEAAIYNLRKHVEVDEPEEDDLTLLMAAQEYAGEESDATDTPRGGVAGAGSAGSETVAQEAPQSGQTSDQESPEPVVATEEQSFEGLSGSYFSEEGVSEESGSVSEESATGETDAKSAAAGTTESSD